MPATTTRTLNPLPFSALEPKRFEDLVRQLAYDFRRWRMLEATGRTGSDEGYDARGFEIVADDADLDDQSDDEAPSIHSADRVWLIQCKREQSIGPAKMGHYLNEIAEKEAQGLYGIIFAAACDFSKATRDVLRSWCREHGISEAHVWGKGEIEDQLFQPKNDHLLFAYFNISLQIRRRSARASLRSMLTMKRKVYRHLGDGQWASQTVLLRDPDDDKYPYVDDSGREKCCWSVNSFSGNDVGLIKIEWKRYYAYLAPDGIHWDCANILNDSKSVDFQDAWLSQEERMERRRLLHEIHEFWYNKISEGEQGTLIVNGLFKYEDIIEIDEKGDILAPFPHLFVPFKDGKPRFYGTAVSITGCSVPKMLDGSSATEPRELFNPKFEHRIERFPSQFRKSIQGES